MWEELGISGGTAIIILITLYFVVKWSVKNGIKEAYRDITAQKLHKNESKILPLDEDNDEDSYS